MPAVRRSLALALGSLLVAVSLQAAASPLMGSAHGSGAVSAFTVYRDSGEAFEGGAHRRNLACIDCFIKLNVTVSAVVYAQNGTTQDMGPGLWEIREFAGYFGYTPRALGHIEFRIDGNGHVVRQ